MQPYFVMSPFAMNEVPPGGPFNTYLSRADGTFSNQGEGARKLLRKACPAAPTRMLPSKGGMERAYEQGGLAVSCARIWGKSAAQIVAQVQAEVASSCRDENTYTCAALAKTLTSHARTLKPAHSLAP